MPTAITTIRGRITSMKSLGLHYNVKKNYYTIFVNKKHMPGFPHVVEMISLTEILNDLKLKFQVPHGFN